MDSEEPENNETDEYCQKLSTKDCKGSGVSSSYIYHPFHDGNDERKLKEEDCDKNEGEICDLHKKICVLSPRDLVKSNEPRETRAAEQPVQRRRNDVKTPGNSPYLNIITGMSVTVTKDGIQKELDDVLCLICAWMNNKANFPLTFTNKNNKETTTHDFDLWIGRIEKNIRLYMFKPIASFIEVKGDCKSPKITFLKKNPVAHTCSLNTHLYFPSVSSHEILVNQDVVPILLQHGPPHKLEELKERVYNMFQPLNDQRNENVDVQFKAITGEDVPNTLANASFEYISAFCNHIGGKIIFGIEDKEGKVLGVPVSIASKQEIEGKLKDKVRSLKFGFFAQKMEKGIHWDVDYLQVHMDGAYYRVKENSKKFISLKKGQTVKLLEKTFKQLWLFEERNLKKKGLARADHFEEIATDGLYAAVQDFKVQHTYIKGEVLKFIDKDNHNDEWWNFVTVNGMKKQLHFSFVKKLNTNSSESSNGKEKANRDSESTYVVVVRVCKVSGGVFTADPESYYADETGNVYKYTLDTWKTKMIESAKEEAEKNVQDICDYKNYQSKKVSDEPIKTDFKPTGSINVDEYFQFSGSCTPSQTSSEDEPVKTTEGITDSKTFDVTPRIALLRNLPNLPLVSPVNGYDQLPVTTETTPASDLARIKYYRNLLAHLNDGKVDGALFTTACKDISDDSVRQLSDEESQETITKINATEPQIGSDIPRASTSENERDYIRPRCPELVTSIWSNFMKLCCCKKRARPQ